MKQQRVRSTSILFIAALVVAGAGAMQGCGASSASPGIVPSPATSPLSLYAGNCPSGSLPPSVATYAGPIGLAMSPSFTSAPIAGANCVGGIAISGGFSLIAATGIGGTAFYNLPITSSSTPVYVIPPLRPNPTFTSSVAVDSTGNLYVVDFLSGAISVYAPPLLAVTAPAFAISGIDHPTQIVFDAAGSLWVGACFSNAVLRFDPPFSSSSMPALSVTLPGATQCPQGLAFDVAGNLYVSARNVNAIYSFSPPFTSASQPAYSIAGAFTQLSAPESLAFDNTGRLFVANGTGATSGVLVFQPPFNANSIPANVLTGVTTPTGLAVGP